MTTFVLHGGETSRVDIRNDVFFWRFTELVEKPEVKILICNWARQKEDWEIIFNRDVEKIKAAMTKKVECKLLEEEEDLEKLIDWCDVFYINGGWQKYIEPHLGALKSIKNLVDCKVVVGSSMGAFYVASYFVMSFDEKDAGVYEGLNLLPTSLLCHWDREKRREMKLKLLRAKDPNLPILTLDECESVVIYC